MRRIIACVLLALPGLAAAQPAELDFQEALSLAQQSPSVKLARSRLELAEKRLEVAASFLSATLSGGYGRTWGELTGPGGTATSLDEGGFDPIALAATLNVVPYGPRFDQEQAARFDVLRAQSALEEAVAEAVVTAAQRYLEALRAGEETDVVQQALAVAKMRLSATEAQAGAGAANEAQALSARIAVSQAENDLAAAERGGLQALASLSLALGREVTAVAGAPPPARAPRVAADGARRLEARDDVLNADLAVAQAEISAAGALRDHLPSGSLSLGYSYGGDVSTLRLGAGFDTRGYQPSLSASLDPDSGPPGAAPGTSSSAFDLKVGLTVPLDPSLGAALDAARLSVEQARAQAQQARALARLDIAGAEAALAAAERGQDLARKLADQRAEAAEDAAERFELGLVSPIERQEARVSAAKAELALHRAEDALLLARMALLRALARSPLEVF